jgi:diguanylate cyclase (GGDEF)-like protein
MSQGRYSGFVGVDFDLQYYLAREARFRSIAIGTFGAALILALIIGYLVARYHSVMQWRIRQLHDNSIRDSLTGFLNRDGVMQFIKPKLELNDGKSALLLVDIDNLKIINDLRGHVTGDAVITRASEVIRESVREGDECARIGDELIIFAPGCDLDTAMHIARGILARLSAQEMPIAGAAFTVSVGVATHKGAGADFARVYRDAESALHQARAEGRDRIAVFGPSTAGGIPVGPHFSCSNRRHTRTIDRAGGAIGGPWSDRHVQRLRLAPLSGALLSIH